MDKKTVKALQEALSRGDKSFEFGAIVEQVAMAARDSNITADEQPSEKQNVHKQ